MKKRYMKLLVLLFVAGQFIFSIHLTGQGVWSSVTALSPDSGGGGMLLLSDGRVIAKTEAGGGDGYGSIWNVLTPDIHGSYVNGTWSSIAPMNSTRLYFSTQILKNGDVYVAGGEYGTGAANAEIYDPVADQWTLIPFTSDTFYDANSNLLPDGTVLQQLIMYNGGFLSNAIYNPATSTYSSTGNCLNYTDESAWLQLPDYSILFIDYSNVSSERYIPSKGKWIADSIVPDSLWDETEFGGALLLPDGRGFFMGASGHTAFYAPTGTNSPGTWKAGPDFPMLNGTADAPASMMVNGNVLCTVEPIPINDTTVFIPPTSFYIFNYSTNSFTQIAAPAGLDTTYVPTYVFNTLDLPDGSVMLSEQGSQQYYIYTPSGSPLASGKPTIDKVTKVDCDNYTVTGKLFNGISQGSTYNDDFQPYTNFPIIRLSSGGNVYYARSHDWNRVGVMTDSLEDTAQFTLPASIPNGTYSLVVIANGISSSPVSFTTCPVGIDEITNNNSISVYPNPGNGKFTLSFKTYIEKSNLEIYNELGETILKQTLQGNNTPIDISSQPDGVYLYRVLTEDGKLVSTGKIVIEK